MIDQQHTEYLPVKDHLPEILSAQNPPAAFNEAPADVKEALGRLDPEITNDFIKAPIESVNFDFSKSSVESVSASSDINTIIQKMEEGVDGEVYYTPEDVQEITTYIDSVGIDSNAGKTIGLLVNFSGTTIPTEMMIDLANASQSSQLDFDSFSSAILLVQEYYSSASQETITNAISTDQHLALFERLLSFANDPEIKLQEYLSICATNGRLRELGQWSIIITPDIIDPTKSEQAFDLSTIDSGALAYYLSHELQWQPYSPIVLDSDTIKAYATWEKDFRANYFLESIRSGNPDKDTARKKYDAANQQINDFVKTIYDQYPNHRRQSLISPTPQSTPTLEPSEQVLKPTSTPSQPPVENSLPPEKSSNHKSLFAKILIGATTTLGLGGFVNHLRSKQKNNQEDDY